MTDEESKRQSAIQDSEKVASKRRFGLFSQPLTNAIGDNGGYKKKIHPRDPDSGKPITQLRNFQTSPTRSGQGSKSYFGELNSLATSNVKDQYIQPGKRLLREENEKRKKGKVHDVSFFTGTGHKVLANSSFEYVQQKNPELDPKRFKDADGRVKSQPRNITSNPQSKVNDQLFKYQKHIPDPYDRAKKIEVERQKKNKKLEGQATFRPNSFAPQLLNSERKVRQLDKQLKQTKPHESKLNIYNHDNPWKSSNPNKKGLYGYFQPFPKYMPSPPMERKHKQVDQKQKEPFKLNNSEILSSPTSSISLNKLNLRRSIHKH